MGRFVFATSKGREYKNVVVGLGLEEEERGRKEKVGRGGGVMQSLAVSYHC